ncbi:MULTISPECIES: adenylyltransferase/cytidyltransferase family protein [unclassified Fusibacter]|uniref:adenylyltransferase/cytidyltransferase family protein n=1 Tax=unclassified Fusibacter TaxID=2624464 RepID=UPI0013E9107B|nr:MULTISPECIES: adenylyltransferase/cytidyltransferase family protein [unclassified Fusibacter]MCK8059766.1 adenylyltransferase/cytidyltransferase family protein [Fusibacter sp. A2]NPE21567.1 adenylyltransferase/cytidyltransferase family protein [Fusibacter sp. A1]
MTTGLVMGKFMPFHKGHIALIEFGLTKVDHLIVLIVTKKDEEIPVEVREKWLQSHYKDQAVTVEIFRHDLPHDGGFGEEDMLKWCEAIASRYPDIDAFISSEAHGDFLANYMGIEHISYEPDRCSLPISATEIRKNPKEYGEYLTEEVKAYYGFS